jgi:DNA-binding transcriptional regulator YhcF (GntR family)
VVKETLDAPAWKALSHGARSLYVAVKRRYNSNNHNNGRVWLSQRDAAQEIGSHHNEIARWYRELQFYGFIRMMTPGGLGVHGQGKAPHWRLTEIGYM